MAFFNNFDFLSKYLERTPFFSIQELFIFVTSLCYKDAAVLENCSILTASLEQIHFIAEGVTPRFFFFFFRNDVFKKKIKKK